MLIATKDQPSASWISPPPQKKKQPKNKTRYTQAPRLRAKLELNLPIDLRIFYGSLFFWPLLDRVSKSTVKENETRYWKSVRTGFISIYFMGGNLSARARVPPLFWGQMILSFYKSISSQSSTLALLMLNVFFSVSDVLYVLLGEPLY